MNGSAYSWLLLAGVGLTAWMWARAARRDARLPVVYVAALVGALVGAKVVYLLAEGWIDWGRPDTARRWLTGKSVLGSLLLGYPAVEWAKQVVGYRTATGDRFAVVAPLGIGLGRVGCWLEGCCPGRVIEPAWYGIRGTDGLVRWPSVPMELAFNIVALAAVGWFALRGRFRGQRFHLYLMGYGVFRFAHEFLRDTPRWVGWLSGYHVAAAAVLLLGVVRFRQRAREERRAAGDGPGGCGGV